MIMDMTVSKHTMMMINMFCILLCLWPANCLHLDEFDEILVDYEVPFNTTEFLEYPHVLAEESDEIDDPSNDNGMDLITIIWYFSTFLALVAFFVVMACSDNSCGRQRKPENPVITPPPTPAPSYREFAPPSYDTVMKKNREERPSVFIITVNEKESISGNSDKDDGDIDVVNIDQSPPIVVLPVNSDLQQRQ